LESLCLPGFGWAYPSSPPRVSRIKNYCISLPPEHHMPKTPKMPRTPKTPRDPRTTRTPRTPETLEAESCIPRIFAHCECPPRIKDTAMQLIEFFVADDFLPLPSRDPKQPESYARIAEQAKRLTVRSPARPMVTLGKVRSRKPKTTKK
jgi:hypothetical protein